MAWSSLAANQIPTFTDLQTSGFTLNSGQSAVTSNECVTKANALAKYNLSSTAMNSFASNQLVPKSAYASGAVTSYSYTVKLGTTLTNVCTATPITIYSESSTWAFGMGLYEDAALTTLISTTNQYIVQTINNDIYNIDEFDGMASLGTDTGNNCTTAYGYTVRLSNDSGNVCTTITTFIYSDSPTFGAGITLYDSASLTTIITSFTFVVESSNIYNLNSTTGAVGTFVGTC
jgi:hypothetical protein